MKPYNWKSALAPLMQSFLEEKRALGYVYQTDEGELNRLDRALADLPHSSTSIPKDTVLALAAKKPHEQHSNRSRRMTVLNEFLRYMLRQEYKVGLIPPRHFPVYHRVFKARILTMEEISALLAAADNFRGSPEFPLLRHEIPLLFRMFVNMGLRLNEALMLKPNMVDLEQGWIRLEQGKNNVARLIPMSAEMIGRVRQYDDTVQTRGIPGSYFFPGTRSHHLKKGSAWNYFRQLLREAKIPYRGRDGGPRIHDLRHTFAVQCLNRWVREKVDLMTALPMLSRYMGHVGISGTQRYLQLTAELYPEIMARLESAYGDLIPTRGASHEAD